MREDDHFHGKKIVICPVKKSSHLWFHVMPQVDAQFRVNSQTEFRALGGYSRGANWAVQIGFTGPDLFGAIGVHSYPTFSGDTNLISNWVAALPEDEHPRLLIDVGENDIYRPYTKHLQQN